MRFFGDPARRGQRAALLFLVLGITAVVAALSMKMICDDAYITFRYVSNAHDGRGLVWNPAPFQPVEGYTSWLWAMVLWVTWSWFAVEPPDSANFLSISFALGQLAILAVAALGIRNRKNGILPIAAMACMLAAVISNRTFLRWMTGGLETALFNMFLVAWVVLAFRRAERRTTGWLACWSTIAALSALSRPDGLLFVAATGAAAALSCLRRERSLRSLAIGLLPLLIVVVHVLWRHSVYGEWLPNTYFAKVATPWPEAGLRYLLCFSFEHGVWLWIVLAATWIVCELARGIPTVVRALLGNLPALAATTGVLGHVAYYVLRVGGDHFEFRVLSQLVPLGALAAIAMMARITAKAWAPIAAVLLLSLTSGIGWAHFAYTEDKLPPAFHQLSPHAPEWSRPLVRFMDRQRLWLQMHFIGFRFPKLNNEAILRTFPRRVRQEMNLDDIPVAKLSAVGVAGWVLPDVAIIDVLGLNDWVTARTPTGDWSMSFLPRDVLVALLAQVDANHDQQFTRAEFVTTFGVLPGSSRSDVEGLISMLLLLFAQTDPDMLTAAEVKLIEPFFANLRFMAHERHAPAEYVADFAPNVTYRGREVTVTKRLLPLTADAIRDIESKWRKQIRSKPR